MEKLKDVILYRKIILVKDDLDKIFNSITNFSKYKIYNTIKNMESILKDSKLSFKNKYNYDNINKCDIFTIHIENFIIKYQFGYSDYNI
jgi:hypothetical protein